MRAVIVRRTSAVVAGLALAAGGIGIAGALQANAAPAAHTTVAAKPAPAEKSATLLIKQGKVKAWAPLKLVGFAEAVPAGSKVQVQRFEKNKWVNFPATTKLDKNARFALTVKSGRVGENRFRVVVGGKVSSPWVSVIVTK